MCGYLISEIIQELLSFLDANTVAALVTLLGATMPVAGILHLLLIEDFRILRHLGGNGGAERVAGELFAKQRIQEIMQSIVDVSGVQMRARGLGENWVRELETWLDSGTVEDPEKVVDRTISLVPEPDDVTDDPLLLVGVLW